MLFGATPFSTISFGGNVISNALVNVTGNRVNFTIGNVTIAGQATVNVTGNRINVSTSNVTVAAAALAVATGSRVNTATGTVTVNGNSIVSVTGNQSNLSIGNVSVKVGQTVPVTGIQANIANGTVTVTANATVSVVGNRVNVTIGNATATGGATVPVTGNRANIATGQYYTISSANTWEKKTITFNGDTVGTFDNDNALSMQLDWFMLFGSNYTSGTASNDWRSYVAANDGVNHTVNLADSTSNYINITGVQLEAGQVASDFEFLPIDVNEERCRRYFQKSYTRGEYAGTATNSAMVTTARIQNTVTNRPTNVFFRPILRATPTMTIYSINGTSGSVSDLGTGTAHQRDEPSVVAVLSSMGMGYLTGVSGLTAGDGFGFHYTADAEL